MGTRLRNKARWKSRVQKRRNTGSHHESFPTMINHHYQSLTIWFPRAMLGKQWKAGIQLIPNTDTNQDWSAPRPQSWSGLLAAPFVHLTGGFPWPLVACYSLLRTELWQDKCSPRSSKSSKKLDGKWRGRNHVHAHIRTYIRNTLYIICILFASVWTYVDIRNRNTVPLFSLQFNSDSTRPLRSFYATSGHSNELWQWVWSCFLGP